MGNTFVLLIGVAWLIWLRLSDRRRAAKRDPAHSLDWIGVESPSVCTIRVDVSPSIVEDRAIQMAAEAMRALGAVEIQRINTGLIGWSRISIPGFVKTPQQIGVKLIREPDSLISSFACGSRPRFPAGPTDLGKNKRVAKRLSSEVVASMERDGRFPLS